MINIQIGNSYSKINGLSSEQLAIVRKALSFEASPNQAFYSKAYKRHRRFMIDTRGNFPTGLLGRAVEAVGAFKGVVLTDTRSCPKPIHSETITLEEWNSAYPAQRQAVTLARKHHHGGIVMPTGTGKSRVIEMLAKTFGVRTLVVVPNLELKRQLTETLHDLVIKGYVSVQNIDSNELEDATGFDCLIIDECHHSAAKTYQKLNKSAWSGIYYRFFLTATYFRNQEHETMPFEAICGPAIYELSHAEAVEKGYIVPIEGYYVDVPTKANNAYTWAEVYSQLVVNNDDRNNIIAYLMKIFKEYPTLCLVKEIAHGKYLSAITGVPFVSGQDDGSRAYITKFNNQEIKSIIGTTGVMGEGLDTKPAEFILIAGLGKAKSAFLQQIGRGVRNYPGKESCKVVLFRDKSHKFTLRHFKAQAKILKELNVKSIKLEIT